MNKLSVLKTIEKQLTKIALEKTPFSDQELKQYAKGSNGFPESFEEVMSKGKMVFVYSHPDAETAMNGENVLARPTVIKNMAGALLVSNAKGLKKGTHVFLNAPRHAPEKLAVGYVDAVKGDFAVISGMSSHFAKIASRMKDESIWRGIKELGLYRFESNKSDQRYKVWKNTGSHWEPVGTMSKIRGESNKDLHARALEIYSDEGDEESIYGIE
jgi:hypothetical protein